MIFDVSETYVTIAGEAPILGEPVYLVRFSGCNLSCAYCDTKYANEASVRVTDEELRQKIDFSCRQFPGIRVLVTGGEPLLGERQDHLLRLIRSMPGIEFFIETNGSIEITDFSISSCSYVADIKTPSSGHGHSFAEKNLERLRPGTDCIKIVLNESDLDWVKDTLARIREVNQGIAVYLSPQWGGVSLARLAQFILSNNLRANMSVQLHKLIWGADARGV